MYLTHPKFFLIIDDWFLNYLYSVRSKYKILEDTFIQVCISCLGGIRVGFFFPFCFVFKLGPYLFVKTLGLAYKFQGKIEVKPNSSRKAKRQMLIVNPLCSQGV